ncbi:MAG TPA: hypothetical protein ENN63_04610, partial [Bacteroidetes bacterium]|nr:hypothetical protein [Bacteroidota bacterium]
MEKLRRGKACRDPNSPLTGLCLSGTQTGSLHRPSHFFPRRLVFHIKPSEADRFQVVRKKDIFLISGVSHQPPRLSWFINPSPGRGRWIPPPA